MQLYINTIGIPAVIAIYIYINIYIEPWNVVQLWPNEPWDESPAKDGEQLRYLTGNDGEEEAFHQLTNWNHDNFNYQNRDVNYK